VVRAQTIPASPALPLIRFRGIAYRAHDPRWAWAPLSGEGAAIHGGRFNPKGTTALYLALTIEGMFAEVCHGFARRFPPLTVVTYDVDCSGVIDLTTEAGRAAAGTDLGVLGCAWMLERAEGRMPPSWALAKRLVAAGAAGALVPSFANGASEGMRNLVLWKWGGDKQRVETPVLILGRNRSLAALR
jgi:RES domain-containing protein